MRVGNRTLATWAGVSLLFFAYFLADGWDEALAEGDRLLAEGEEHAGFSPLDEVRLLLCLALIRGARGESTDAILARMEATGRLTSDAFAGAALAFVRGQRALFVGRYADAAREYLAGSDEANIGEVLLGRAARAALWARDTTRAVEIARLLDEHPSSSAPTVAGRIAVHAGIAALEGRRDDAVAGYRDAIARYRAIGEDKERALLGIDFVRLVGAADPAARTAAEEARAILVRAGAQAYLALLDDALAAPPAEARANEIPVVGAATATPA